MTIISHASTGVKLIGKDDEQIINSSIYCCDGVFGMGR